MTQEMREDHLINQSIQLGIIGRHIRDDSLDRVVSRVEDGKNMNADIDLAFLCENEYPVLPSLDVLSTNFGA